MMAETIRCYIPIPRASAAARNRRRAERGRKPREGRGAPEGDRARGRGERRRRGGGHGSDGRRERCRDGAVRARRCARADRGRSDRRLFPSGAVRRTATRGRNQKAHAKKSRNRSVLGSRQVISNDTSRTSFFLQSQTVDWAAACGAEKPPPPDHENGGARSAWKKRTTTPRSGRRRTPRAHTSPRAARPTLTPSSSLSLSACVPSPRSCSRSSPAPREAAEPRATTAVERRRHRGGVLGARFFQTAPRGGARARPRREGAGIVTIGRD